MISLRDCFGIRACAKINSRSRHLRLVVAKNSLLRMHACLANRILLMAVALVVWTVTTRTFGQAQSDAALPAGVRAVWDPEKAYREKTSTRERICLNGLWRWQPASASSASVPDANWGFFKVPGCWPGITDYLQKDFQTVYAHPSWQNQALRNLTTAWYQREIMVPKEWTGRRIVITVEYLNSLATVFVDKMKVGEVRFLAGEVEHRRRSDLGRRRAGRG